MNKEELINYFLGLKVIVPNGDSYRVPRKALNKIPKDFKLPDGFKSNAELVYCLIHDLMPSEQLCPICGKLRPFRSISKGYYHTCCDPECVNKLGAITRKSICLEKYGVTNVAKLDSVKDKMRSTCLERYGSTSYFGTEEFKDKKDKYWLENYGDTNPFKTEHFKDKSKETKLELYGNENYVNREKAESTNLERYGVANVFQSEIVKDKIKLTNLDKYGKEYALQVDSIRDKGRISQRESAYKFRDDNEMIDHQEVLDKYGQGWLSIKRFINYTSYDPNIDYKGIPIIRYGQYSFIPKKYINKIEDYCDKHKYSCRSHMEVDVEEFIKSIYDGEVITSKYSIIPPYQLDIYIPDKSVAVEFNGDYYHSNLPSDYHLKKTQLCSEKGIRLIHIFEHDWLSNKMICKSIIASALGIYEDRIYARKCIINKLDYNTYKIFCDNNHIHGVIPTKYRYGLFYNDELVQVIGISNNRFSSDPTPELYRMCTKLNTQVVGGFSKLIKYAMEDLNIDSLISFVDRSLFNASGYNKLGFELVETLGPTYCYYKDGKVLSRQSAMKFRLPKLLGDIYDPNLTEEQNMSNAGYLKIYNSGNFKLKYTKH